MWFILTRINFFLFHIRCADLLKIRLVRLVFLLFEYNTHFSCPPPSKNVYGGQQFFFALRTKYLALANPDKMSGCARAHAASHYWPMIFYQMLITDSQIIIATSLLTFQNVCKIEFLIRANAKMETLTCNSVVFKTLIIKHVCSKLTLSAVSCFTIETCKLSFQYWKCLC